MPNILHNLQEFIMCPFLYDLKWRFKFNFMIFSISLISLLLNDRLKVYCRWIFFYRIREFLNNIFVSLSSCVNLVHVLDAFNIFVLLFHVLTFKKLRIFHWDCKEERKYSYCTLNFATTAMGTKSFRRIEIKELQFRILVHLKFTYFGSTRKEIKTMIETNERTTFIFIV